MINPIRNIWVTKNPIKANLASVRCKIQQDDGYEFEDRITWQMTAEGNFDYSYFNSDETPYYKDNLWNALEATYNEANKLHEGPVFGEAGICVNGNDNVAYATGTVLMNLSTAGTTKSITVSLNGNHDSSDGVVSFRSSWQVGRNEAKDYIELTKTAWYNACGTEEPGSDLTVNGASEYTTLTLRKDRVTGIITIVNKDYTPSDTGSDYSYSDYVLVSQYQ